MSTPAATTKLLPEELSTGDVAAHPIPRLALPLEHPGDQADATRVEDERQSRSRSSRLRLIRRRLLVVSDVVAADLAVVLVLGLFGESATLAALLAAIPLVLGTFWLGGLYDAETLRVLPSTLDEVPAMLQMTGLSVLGFAIFQPTLRPFDLHGEQLGVLWMTSFLAVAAGRLGARWLTRRTSPVQRCLLLASVAQAPRIAERLAASQAPVRVIACLPMSDADVTEFHKSGIIEELVDELNIDRMIIAPMLSTEGTVTLIRIAKTVGVSISVIPPALELVGARFNLDDITGIPMLGARRLGLSRSSGLLKRAFDLVTTVLGLIIIGPVLLLIAIAIRIDSKGPALFKQIRVGRDGKPFWMIKFRSMIDGADALKDDLCDSSRPEDGMFKLTDDPRVTRVGRLIRRTSLDELPQLLNVLRGDMSLVGPRPLVTEEDLQISGLDRARLLLTPGMTGPWQVLNTRVPIEEMVAIDYLYAVSWSMWFDLKILFRTVRHVACRRNV